MSPRTHLGVCALVLGGMGLEWVLLSLLLGGALWLGVDACRESRRLHQRLSRVRIDGPLLVESDWASRTPR